MTGQQDFGVLFPAENGLLNQFDRQLNGAGGDIDCLKRGVQAFRNQFESGGTVHCHGIDFNG